MGPAPALAQVRRAVRSALQAPAGPPHRVLVACSGGADSLALAVATAFEAPRAGISAGLITVDHGLQAAAAEQAARVAELGYQLGFDPVQLVPVGVGRRGGPEAAARTARYAALRAAAEALDAAILLGHTLDDQAETVLLGLGRGSGPRSVAGMRAVQLPYLRPLLRLRRATTEAACAAVGLSPWQDPHNADPVFQRVRLRHEVLPLLEEVLAGGVAEALARTAGLLADDLEALDAWSCAVLAECDVAGQLAVAGLTDLPRAVRTRVLRRWVDRWRSERSREATPLSAERTGELDALVTRWHGQGPIQLPGGVSVRRESDRLIVDDIADVPPTPPAVAPSADPDL